MKIRILALTLLIIFFSAGTGVCIYWKNAPGEDAYMAATLAYLEEQKAALYEGGGNNLYLCGDSGAMYPEVRETVSEGVIRQLQQEIVFGDQDVVTDLTDVNLEPMALPIEINGRGSGTFEQFFAIYQETGQFICIVFSPEDSESFYKYVMNM